MSNFRLPHWAQMTLALALVVITWIMNQMAQGTLVLPAAVMSALVLLKTIIGLLSPSVSPSTNVAAVKRASLHPGPMVGMMCLLLAACSSGCGFLTAAIPGIIDIADAECTQAEQQPSTPGWIDFLCTVLTPKPGEAAKFTYRVKGEDAPQFAALHAPKGGH